jgi:acyl phosphate:glycerol-3-phosphate acyltransferase
MWAYLFSALASYFAGAIPVSYLIGRSRGVDIRQHGSGNVGATNVFRTVGKTWGILAFAGDFAKGFVPTFLFPLLAARVDATPDPVMLAVACGCSAVIGHVFPVYLGFKGGKGVATSAGVLLGIAPAAVGIGVCVFLGVFLASRYVSLASILAAAVIADAAWGLYWEPSNAKSLTLPIALTALAALTIYRHKSNIRRLLNGTENRFSRQSKS